MIVSSMSAGLGLTLLSNFACGLPYKGTGLDLRSLTDRELTVLARAACSPAPSGQETA